MGAIRALAQEPVQNSKDAASRGRAEVEYRLHKRRSENGIDFYLLTITDSNTTDLRGSIHSLSDLVKGAPLAEGENWAAFEGMGYTKKASEDVLGSRGQGKAAYLYHSSPPPLTSLGPERMVMLYDTLLPGGEYRLGVWYANPNALVRQPPFLGEEARNVVSTRHAEEGMEIELGLKPLTQVGTRVIVPYLSPEALEAFQSGELYRWLQRCWWRAVQTGLAIALVNEHGIRQEVDIPSWWESEPWKRRTDGLRLYRDIDVGDGLKIKRIVLRYDEALGGDDPDFWGVQLLRGRQWIETLGQEALGDYIPRVRRPGFRGFVEFEREAELAFRRGEKPQHERFDRRSYGVKELIDAIEARVAKFAEEQGWSQPAPTRHAPGAEQAIAYAIQRFFARGAHRRPDEGRVPAAPGSQPPLIPQDPVVHWECDLRFDLPDPSVARVDWGQSIRNVEADVRIEPPPAFGHGATVSLEATPADHQNRATVVARVPVEVRGGTSTARFGDFQIIRGLPSAERIQCPEPGQYRLRARVEASGSQVAKSAARSIYVNEDPPERLRHPYSLSISVANHSPRQQRINSGDIIGVQVSVTNRSVNTEDFTLTASLGDLLLADDLPKACPGDARRRRVAPRSGCLYANHRQPSYPERGSRPTTCHSPTRKARAERRPVPQRRGRRACL